MWRKTKNGKIVAHISKTLLLKGLVVLIVPLTIRAPMMIMIIMAAMRKMVHFWQAGAMIGSKPKIRKISLKIKKLAGFVISLIS